MKYQKNKGKFRENSYGDHQHKLRREGNKNQTWQIKPLFPYLKLLKFVGKQNITI